MDVHHGLTAAESTSQSSLYSAVHGRFSMSSCQSCHVTVALSLVCRSVSFSLVKVKVESRQRIGMSEWRSNRLSDSMCRQSGSLISLDVRCEIRYGDGFSAMKSWEL